jgi:hypothetical protein
MTKKQRKAKAAKSRRRTQKARAAHQMLKLMNPAGVKKVDAVRIKRLKGGGVSILPIKNPGKFARCVKDVKARGGSYDPNAVCAAAGRAKYGQRAMTRKSIAGKKRAARRRSR